MYIEFIATKPSKSLFEDFIRLEIYKNTNGDIQLSKIPVDLNPNSLKNIFTFDDYECNILMVDVNTYKITLYKPDLKLSEDELKIKFGCELETCLSLNCIENTVIDINSMFAELKMNNNVIIWKELIIIYIIEVVLKYASLDFKRTFPKICIALNPKSGLINYIIDSYELTIDEIKDVNFNKYLTFTRDASLKCGDTVELSMDKTIHCEIITPTMFNMDELELLYNSIVNPLCLKYNPSTAFHINISFEKPVYFSFGFCDELIKIYRSFEELNYRLNENGKESSYAPKLYDTMILNILKDIGSIIYYGDKKSYKYKSRKFINEYYRAYVDFNEKYSALYCKSNRLIEFRLFSSDNEVKNLLVYLKNSIRLIERSYINYNYNFNKNFTELQEINLNTGIDLNILDYFEGPLYAINPENREDELITVLSNNSKIIYALKHMFAKRKQIFYDINYHSSKYYFIRTIKNGIGYNYLISKGSKNNFVIEKVK